MNTVEIIWEGLACEEGCPNPDNACFLCVEDADMRGYYDID